MSKRLPPLGRRPEAPVKAINAISDLSPDGLNANRGTERGVGLLEHSLRRYGAGRSILVDRNGRVIAGNKTLEQAVALGIEEIEVVRTRGNKLVVVQREDLDLDDDANSDARELAVADNRIAELDLDWNADTMKALQAKDTDLTAFFTDDELADVFGSGKRKERVDFTATKAECRCCKSKCRPSCGCYDATRVK